MINIKIEDIGCIRDKRSNKEKFPSPKSLLDNYIEITNSIKRNQSNYVSEKEPHY